jgi:hypothetical protein
MLPEANCETRGIKLGHYPETEALDMRRYTVV